MFKNNYCLTVDKTRNGYSIGFRQNSLEMPSAINYVPTVPMGIKVEELSSLDLDVDSHQETRRLLGSERRKLPQDTDQIRHARLQYYSNSNTD
ncbi:Hypothetical protein ORPV_1061 [Orpheovirus IHUMI-LCC2]|uniref:Uncharacterized protein n=1 Tax=Orpheovirus IHUMI-LCC2 TaxID=2023057 RepID=A0A2I2L5Y5_9VIRU|nr:Hypothetical protein ORPV_1061 [Orpheovirus IHUMI-LCC2]SNW62965.1 Hypothetical protein ORPV_1061 [Orpheovirus IHUMI-LCC2]